jgi:hypothetical protein
MKTQLSIIFIFFSVIICCASCKSPQKTISKEKQEQIDRDKKSFEKNMKSTDEQ